ncbi:hypothetical protein F3Y22_tig00110575pilonHSYRG00004 [Hibiscus syriacus]|uniref:Uncharacterized protein n=1 Tax=Hibiscus syriacus TaxID=106335 RepID=A0A6A3A5K8_HIBSY|nr:hypothetical protein F3Y22_tig00110575pilonHSYRG00004 [Hibiscus syriacus]
MNEEMSGVEVENRHENVPEKIDYVFKVVSSRPGLLPLRAKSSKLRSGIQPAKKACFTANGQTSSMFYFNMHEYILGVSGDNVDKGFFKLLQEIYGVLCRKSLEYGDGNINGADHATALKGAKIEVNAGPDLEISEMKKLSTCSC